MLDITLKRSDLESFVEPKHGAGRHVANPMQVARNQMGLIEPAPKHIVGLVPHSREQRVVVYGSKNKIRFNLREYTERK